MVTAEQEAIGAVPASAMGSIIGVITARDIDGERPLKLIRERGHPDEPDDAW